MSTAANGHGHEVLWLFGADWSSIAAGRFELSFRVSRAGFDLFSFPCNLRLLWFDMERFVDKLVRRHGDGLAAVVSHDEQFGALTAALVAERLGLPGPSPESVLRLQHKFMCRELIGRVAPEANLSFRLLPRPSRKGAIPQLAYPVFVKPIKATFSVLARCCEDEATLRAHMLFGRFEQHLIDRLIKPFVDVCSVRLNAPVDARHMLIEDLFDAPQFNLDGYVFRGEARMLGVIDELMYPETRAFRRFVYPSSLPKKVQERAFQLAVRILAEAEFDHGFFSMEFFYDAQSDDLRVIEFNPRLSSQMADLYERVDGIDVHGMSIALALGDDPARVPARAPLGSVAASCALRTFDGVVPPRAPRAFRRVAERTFPDACILFFDKSGIGWRRELKWMQSNRYGVINLHAKDIGELDVRYAAICTALAWPADC